MIEDRKDIERSNDEVSLMPLLVTLWAYRRTIAMTFVVVMFSAIAAVITMYARAPMERIASLGFQLTFEGAEQGRLPNGTKFSVAEIVASPVLSEVFRQNEIERFANFSDFKRGLFVIEADPQLQLLAYEYQAKLSDPRLSPVDRARIEEEFRTKRDSLKSAQFALNMRASGRLGKIPDNLLAKVLQDTLSTWAVHLADRKGGIRYDIPLASKYVLKKDLLSAEDPVVAVDMLRSTTVRMVKTVEEIAKLPGAATLRIGKERISLEDIKVNLQNILQFKVGPLVAVISAAGLSPEGSRLDAYFQGRIVAIQLDRAEVERRIKTLQEALEAYQRRAGNRPDLATGPGSGAVSPQLSESFLDRLLEMSSQSSDMVYRQQLTDRIISEGLTVADLNKQAEYYESIRKAFASNSRATNAGLQAEVSRRTQQILSDINSSMSEIEEMYKLLGEQNLNPNTVLYTVTSPFVAQKERELNTRAVMLFLGAALFLTTILVPLGCLSHSYFRQRVAPLRPSRKAAPEYPADRMAGV